MTPAFLLTEKLCFRESQTIRNFAVWNSVSERKHPPPAWMIQAALTQRSSLNLQLRCRASNKGFLDTAVYSYANCPVFKETTLIRLHRWDLTLISLHTVLLCLIFFISILPKLFPQIQYLLYFIYSWTNIDMVLAFTESAVWLVGICGCPTVPLVCVVPHCSGSVNLCFCFWESSDDWTRVGDRNQCMWKNSKVVIKGQDV